MDLARYVLEAVALEGRSYREVARAHGVSKSWVGKVVGRFREGGYEALAGRSRAQSTVPHRSPPELEDEIVALRKELTDLGVDAGAATIAYHLCLSRERVSSVSTVWRVLRRRGFVTPQPHKRPRSSWTRFEADLPNERWQSKGGKLTLRRRTRLHHIAVGYAHKGERVIMLIDGLDVRILSAADGQLLRDLRLDPSRSYQPKG